MVMTHELDNIPERSALVLMRAAQCLIQDMVVMADMVEAEDVGMEIIVEVDVMVVVVVVVVKDCHPMLDGVMVDNIIQIVLIVTNFFVLTVGEIDMLVKIIGT